MHLHPGQADEYRRRRDALWPELRDLLKDVGVSDYSIFLDEETGILLAVLTRAPDHRMDELPAHAVMQRWWHHMADIMETEVGDKPVSVPLRPMFHLD